MRLRSKGLPFGTRDGVAARARFTGRAGTPIARKHPENFPVFGVFSCLLKKSGTCPDFFVAPEALHFMRSAARRDFWVQKSLRDFWIGVNMGARGRLGGAHRLPCGCDYASKSRILCRELRSRGGTRRQSRLRPLVCARRRKSALLTLFSALYEDLTFFPRLALDVG